MNKKISFLLIFVLLISINLAFAGNNKNNGIKSDETKYLTSRLERLYKLNIENKEYLQFARKSDIKIIEDRVVVAVLAKPGLTTADIDENDLRTFGARIQAKAGHSMRVEIPISELVNVATAIKGSAYITLPIKPFANDVISEGVGLMNADAWLTAGDSGAGVKVAIIDGGFDSLSEAYANGDIPSSIYDSCNFTGSGFQATTEHGTAVTEAIFDLVPKAEFYLYKIYDQTDFENAVDSCDSNDVDIINHSCVWCNAGGYYNGTGLICEIVDTVISHGRLWVNSAGNYAERHYRAVFSDYGNNYHVFHGPPDDTINSTGPYLDGQYVKIRLNWDDYDSTDQDYDLYLVQDTGNVTTKWVLVASSTNRQDGPGPSLNDNPEEKIDFLNSEAGATYGVLVKNFSATGTADFTLFSPEGDLGTYMETNSIPDPGTVTDVVTVGAINRPVYNTTGAIEYFSSRGPTNDGRIKPDVAAPDGCSSFTYRNLYPSGYWYGTSLSSPHTAGVCALIKSRFSSFNDTDIRNYLYNNCSVDLGTTGKDNIYGWGKVVMPDIGITVTSPNGGEHWYVDSTYNITWTSGGTSGGVQIEYSVDSGTTWSDVITSMPDTGAYPWTIPDVSSISCVVSVTDTNGSLADTSDAWFRISPTPTITVTSPNGGENWGENWAHYITWSSSNTSGKVKIEYSTDNGNSWIEEIACTTDVSPYAWTTPSISDTLLDTCLVAITDTTGFPSDTSDAFFTIYPIYITVTSPNGGENWLADSTYDITWNSNGTIGKVRIEYSINNGTSWSDIIASIPDTGAYSWTTPDTTSDSCLVRITDTCFVIPSDTSDSVFSITSPYITVTSPNGGEVWYIDSTYDITWNSEGTSEFLFIDYSIDSGTTWLEVTSYAHPDSGSYSWTIPNTPSTNCFVRIGDSASIDQTPLDTSDAVFEIAPAPYITITSPNGGEVWYIDSTYDITWTTNLTVYEGVLIEYSTDNGTNWSEIITGKPADTLAYAWTIPNTPSDSCLVRITDTTGSPSDTSDAIFTIAPTSGVPSSQTPSVYSMVVKTVTVGNQLEVKYGLPEKADVRFDIYDIKGTKIKEISEEHTPGFYSIKINMADKPAGVYFLIMEANKNKFTESQKVILVK
jgi:hypothetical protein